MPAATPPPGVPPATRSADAPPPGTVLPQHYDGCFACGDGHPAGLHLRVVAGEDVSVRGTFTVTRSHQGAPLLAHGGLLATAVDEAMGFVHTLIGSPAVTAHLEVDYRLPVPVGTEVALEARCVGKLDRKIWTVVEGRLPDGRVAFSGQALFLVVPVEHFARATARPDVAEKIMARFHP